jgi:hypothetical protein
MQEFFSHAKLKSSEVLFIKGAEIQALHVFK